MNFRRYVLLFWVSLDFLLSPVVGFAQPEYTALVPASVPPPLLFDPNLSAPTGLIVDYTQALARELGATIKMITVPRKRIDEFATSGKMDLNCYSNALWNDGPDHFYWSQTFFYVRDLVVSYDSTLVPNSIQDLSGKTVGAVLGYKYPALSELFDSKKVIREDAANEESNLKKLLHKRVPLIVMDELYLKYHRRNHPEAQISTKELLVQEYPIQCGLSRKSKLTLKELDKAITALKTSKKLEQIFAKYK